MRTVVANKVDQEIVLGMGTKDQKTASLSCSFVSKTIELQINIVHTHK